VAAPQRSIRTTVLASTLCLIVWTGLAGASPAQVAITDFAYSPTTVAISPGERVDWAYALGDGTQPHTVTADDGSFDSESLTPGGSFSRTFDSAGTYPYYCTFHGDPGGVGMAGAIKVAAAGSSPEDKPTATKAAAPGSSPSNPTTPTSQRSVGPSSEPTPSTSESSATSSPTASTTPDGAIVARGEADPGDGVPAGPIAGAIAAIAAVAIALILRAKASRAGSSGR
jgi:plastocyanin